MRNGAKIAVIIPAYNEEASVGPVLSDVPAWVDQVVVADNASTDHTAAVATEHGATVVHEPERGYGAACLRAMEALDAPDIVVFLDADYSDDPAEMAGLVDPILSGDAEVVIGSRVLGRCEPGALTPQQRYGNWLACLLMHWIFGVRHTDLGPFRAIRWPTLIELEMADRNWGWTVELQVKAAKRRIRALEVPVSYRRRIGKSKISGTVRGVVSAGFKILYTIGKEAVVRGKKPAVSQERLVVFTRYPVAGRTKTRLIPALGPEGAAALHRKMTAWTVRMARQAMRTGLRTLQVHFTGGHKPDMVAWLGPDLEYRQQSEGDLGARMHDAFARAFSDGTRRVVIVGTDCPGLAAETIRKAFALLRSQDLVLGPTDDGGYYLIGLRQPAAHLFGDVAWGTDSVLQITMARAANVGLRTALLPKMQDVDTTDDLPVWDECGPHGHVETPALSIVIPALNEERCIGDTLSAIGDHAAVEVIVVDGGSSDNTVSLAETYGAQVMCAARGRALQMNAGAAAAHGQILLFLHADTRLPLGYLREVRRMLSLADTSAGAFQLGIDGSRFVYRLIEWGSNLRSRFRQMPYGDQGIFMRRETFELIGGYPEMPILEDYALVRRLLRLGRVRIAGGIAMTSARRWKKSGPWALTLRHRLILLGYKAGVDPARLAALRK